MYKDEVRSRFERFVSCKEPRIVDDINGYFVVGDGRISFTENKGEAYYKLNKMIKKYQNKH